MLLLLGTTSSSLVIWNWHMQEALLLWDYSKQLFSKPW